MNYQHDTPWFEVQSSSHVLAHESHVDLVYEPIPNEGQYEGDLYSRILKDLDALPTRG
jgi:hypothetical protein